MQSEIIIENNSINCNGDTVGIYANINAAILTDQAQIILKNNVVIGNGIWGDYLYANLTIATIKLINNAADDNSLPLDDSVPIQGIIRSKNINNIIPADEFESIDPNDDDYLKILSSTGSAVSDPTKGQVQLDVVITPTVDMKKLADHGVLDVSDENISDIIANPRPNLRGKISIGAYEV
jgi:hypothetical protein